MEIKEFKGWLNKWANVEYCPDSKEFREGYRKAVQDIGNKFDILELNLNKDVKKEPYKRWKEEENNRLIELFELGYPIKEIAKELNRSYSTTASNIRWFKSQGIIDENSIKERDLGKGIKPSHKTENSEEKK